MRVVTVSLVFILFLSSCQSANKTQSSHQFEGRHILFFTDVKTMSEEAAYYDAILQLKSDYPEEIQNMVVFQASNNMEEPFNIHTYPSLVIVENNEIIVHIKGHVETKETIIQKVHEAFSK